MYMDVCMHVYNSPMIDSFVQEIPNSKFDSVRVAGWIRTSATAQRQGRPVREHEGARVAQDECEHGAREAQDECEHGAREAQDEREHGARMAQG